MTQTVEAPSQWVPIALSKMIEAGTSAGVVAAGAEIVVWRDTSGVAHAWEDRCPHRGMKMSFGFVRGDHITCLYHGWEYDETGICQYIPAHPELEVPKSICVARYGVAEAGGMIWAHLPLGSDASASPDVPVMDGVKSVYIDAPVATALDQLRQQGGTECGVVNVVSLERDGTKMTIGIQPISHAQCALHITVPESATKDTRMAVLDWSEGLRRRIEELEATA
ncbi:Rieske (2Fe-2S) protein [Roseicitreum antarcticum]|uniref:Rieske [2Fe-2S] domain-containing protein n=1 Tax=Roseicitreum antarcticum TaxID=564137 RepID=A0A1H2ZPT0_9RHOB|nr:Rieske (2Fe-2S) protein [Roseicitreum antarcticum]SDX18854.1 Rieske [2Fe-2S] domain-containing protein [Roseicitreum antarcticum]